MRAIDVMVTDVATIHPETDVAEAIELLAEHDVSALPVVDSENMLVGILSETDLIERVEIGTEKQRPWWLEAVTAASTLARDFAKFAREKGWGNHDLGCRLGGRGHAVVGNCSTPRA